MKYFYAMYSGTVAEIVVRYLQKEKKKWK